MSLGYFPGVKFVKSTVVSLPCLDGICFAKWIVIATNNMEDESSPVAFPER
jgi:hypothetical protein